MVLILPILVILAGVILVASPFIAVAISKYPRAKWWFWRGVEIGLVPGTLGLAASFYYWLHVPWLLVPCVLVSVNIIVTLGLVAGILAGLTEVEWSSGTFVSICARVGAGILIGAIPLLLVLRHGGPFELHAALLLFSTILVSVAGIQVGLLAGLAHLTAVPLREPRQP